MLDLLSPDCTDLLQPLDVAVFATQKNQIRTLIEELVEEDGNGYYAISKDGAIKIAGIASRGPRIGQNVESSFRSFGLFPLSLVR